MHGLLLLLSLGGVWLGTELAVRSARQIARRFHLSELFVGMTILAIGTDAPEMVLSITAAIHRLGGAETSGLVLGGAIGSCLGQISLVLGIAGLVGYLTIGPRRIWREGVMLVGAIVLFFLTGLDGTYSRIDGGILLTAYAIYFGLLLRSEHAGVREKSPPATVPGLWALAMCLSGLAIVVGSAHFALREALALCDAWGIEQTVVGIVILGVGTSLPELALSISAVHKKAGALSVGNILGSNTFDMLVPTGSAALIAGLRVTEPRMLFLDLPVLLGVTLLALACFRRRRGLQRPEALLLLGTFVAYAVVRLALG